MQRNYQHTDAPIYDDAATAPDPAALTDPGRPHRAAATCDMCGANLAVQGHDQGCAYAPEPVAALDRTGRDAADAPSSPGFLGWLFGRGGGRR